MVIPNQNCYRQQKKFNSKKTVQKILISFLTFLVLRLKSLNLFSTYKFYYFRDEDEDVFRDARTGKKKQYLFVWIRTFISDQTVVQYLYLKSVYLILFFIHIMLYERIAFKIGDRAFVDGLMMTATMQLFMGTWLDHGRLAES